MGDMADLYYDYCYDPEELWRYEEDFFNDAYCKYCKKGGYHWVLISDNPVRWRLATPTGRLHKCKAYKIAATTLRNIKLT